MSPRAASIRILAAAMASVGALAASAAHAQSRDWDALEARRYSSCLEQVEANPEAAYEEGLAWRFEGGGAPAAHCVASALIALGRIEEGAARLEATALAPDGGATHVRAQMMLQAADAWFSIDAPAEAQRALSDGLSFAPGDPDLLVARGLALGLQRNFDAAAQDLSIALAERPGDVEALRLRAEAYLQLGELDRAERDIETALAIDPEDIETLVVRGRLNETRRTGVVPDLVR